MVVHVRRKYGCMMCNDMNAPKLYSRIDVSDPEFKTWLQDVSTKGHHGGHKVTGVNCRADRRAESPCNLRHLCCGNCVEELTSDDPEDTWFDQITDRTHEKMCEVCECGSGSGNIEPPSSSAASSDAKESIGISQVKQFLDDMAQTTEMFKQLVDIEQEEKELLMDFDALLERCTQAQANPNTCAQEKARCYLRLAVCHSSLQALGCNYQQPGARGASSDERGTVLKPPLLQLHQHEDDLDTLEELLRTVREKVVETKTALTRHEEAVGGGGVEEVSTRAQCAANFARVKEARAAAVHTVAQRRCPPTNAAVETFKFGLDVLIKNIPRLSFSKRIAVGAGRRNQGSGDVCLLQPTYDDAVAAVVRRVTAVIRHEDSAVCFTSLSINAGASPLHVDNRGNIGDGAIISAGQESGGALWEYEVDKGTSRVVDCHFKLRRFDGQRNPHFTLAYSGQRYSVVAYIHRDFNQLEKCETAYLKELGFNLPSPELMATLKTTRAHVSDMDHPHWRSRSGSDESSDSSSSSSEEECSDSGRDRNGGGGGGRFLAPKDRMELARKAMIMEGVDSDETRGRRVTTKEDDASAQQLSSVHGVEDGRHGGSVLEGGDSDFEDIFIEDTYNYSSDDEEEYPVYFDDFDGFSDDDDKDDADRGCYLTPPHLPTTIRPPSIHAKELYDDVIDPVIENTDDKHDRGDGCLEGTVAVLPDVPPEQLEQLHFSHETSPKLPLLTSTFSPFRDSLADFGYSEEDAIIIIDDNDEDDNDDNDDDEEAIQGTKKNAEEREAATNRNDTITCTYRENLSRKEGDDRCKESGNGIGHHPNKRTRTEEVFT